MFCILLVEDEKIERETLQGIIEKQIVGCDAVYAARNVKEAMELFHQYHPKLVCADINLPGKNGLEMIKQMKQEASDVQYLILSSYNYFEYAQKAIRLGVNDFILKPYNIPDFIEVLKQTIIKIQESNVSQSDLQQKLHSMTPMLERECLYGIISDEAELELRRRIHLLDEHISSGFCVVVREAQYDETHMQAFLSAFKQSYPIFAQMHGTMVYFMMYHQPLVNNKILDIKEILEYSFEKLNNVGIGPVVNDISDFHRSFLLAREHVGMNLALEDQLFAFHAQKKEETLQQSAQHFMEIFEKNEETEFKKAVRSFIEKTMSLQASKIVETCNLLYDTLLKMIQEQYPKLAINDFHLLSLYAGPTLYQDFPMNLNLNLKKMYFLIEEERFRNTNHLVKEAMHYIEQNYRRQIVLDDLAQYLKVSPYHISRLLSASLHKTFTELVAQKRVEYSKILLKSDERIKEIARDVGFQGQSYYNKIFKKYTGMTPKEYRNSIKS